ncbi:phage tail protein [Limosilactobacillus sp. Sa3CUN2]|uniref:Phage tail protein n=1 Tax=Limosilactobacillus avistercoris TaxID=2762243 RepID=A0ABR8PB65_9LACO|nr:phage tail protein [Limosilactobacillus avistercoris]MBD7894546.1 phage tail protein [Limosilactobacillus avistercoris]
MKLLEITNNLNNQTDTMAEPFDWNDLFNSFQVNFQINSAYEISFTATYTEQYKYAFNMLKMKRYLWYKDQYYVIQQLEEGLDDNGLPTMHVTANAMLIDLMKNVRLDKKQPTEGNPDVSGNDSSDSSDDKSDQQQPAEVIKKTDEQQTYTLQNRLDQFFNGNDQGIKYELHGDFPQAAVDCTGSLYEWLGQNLVTFGAYYIPNNFVLEIYDLPSLKRPTDQVFYYMNNTTNVNIQMDGNDMVNECDVYGGKMEKDINGGAGGGGNLDSAVGFAKSPINASFGVNKGQMCQDFANRDVRVRAWGVDVNKLYDTVKSAGVSPEWFFAYDLQEGNPTSFSWLNHFGNHLSDPYADAQRVCNWIKQWAFSDGFTPASGYGAYASPQLTAQWNQEFGKGTIGRLYLQGTAAAVMELANENMGRYGKPLQGCVNQIKAWGGHTVSSGGGGGWGWPFPCGEGTFSQAQKFGYDGGYRTNSFHDGLDFGSIDHPGSEVHAIHGGKCTISRAWGSGGINWYCVITDSTGLNVEYQEAFGSASDIYVNVGDNVQTGQVIGRRTTNHLHVGITRHSFPEAFHHAFSNDGTWLDPQAMIKSGGANIPSNSSDNSQSVSETYYALYFHYRDEDSIKKYGLHRGSQIVMDSIYDMNALKNYTENTVKHDPPTTLSNNVVDVGNMDIHLGNTGRLVVPENSMNTEVTLMGYHFNPFNPNADSELTWNNNGLTMKDAIFAMYQDINQINKNVDQLDYYGAIGGRNENHFDNLLFSKNQVDDMVKISRSEGKGNGDK